MFISDLWATEMRARLASIKARLMAGACAIPATLAFTLLFSDTALAQSATPPSNDAKETVAPEAGAQPETTDQNGQAPSDGQTIPKVVVEQEPPAAEPTPRPSRRPARRAVRPEAPAEAELPPDETARALEGIIFETPQTGDTLNRGTTGVDGYYAAGTSVATKTNTQMMNIPGSVAIITEQMAEDQAANSLGRALLYVPGITVQQGEGHRDQLSIRGQRTTADFFVDGVRDDIETFRDLYNAQTVEVLKGPLAMIFGRGGGGGVINRVLKKADGTYVRDGIVQSGSYGRARATVDVGQAVSENFAFRMNAMYEDTETFRDFSWLERYGLNPTMGFKLGPKTTFHMSYEYKVHDQNVDRGGPSFQGRPFKAPLDTFFGQPITSYTNFDGHIATATLQHETQSGLQFRNHTFYATYDKFYQNVFATSAINALGNVTLGGYNSLTDRESFFNQSDFAYSFQHSSQVRHTVLAGVEIGIQDNVEFRNQPARFNDPVAGPTSITVPASSPTIFNPTFYTVPQRRRFSDLQTISAYVQDQIEITSYFELIGGVRFEHFDLDFRTAAGDQFGIIRTSRIDNVWSPRIGGVFKPYEHFHFYLSYSNSFLPQNGDNFGGLSFAASNLEPEEFINYETGFKWMLRPRLLFTGAVYQLDRDNQPVLIGPDLFASGLTRTRGGELEINGYLTDRWQVFGGWAYTDAEILFAGNNVALVGNTPDSVPLNTFSLWNKFQLNERWGLGLGIIHQSSWFAEANNTVEVPGYTRFDGAVYYTLNEHWEAQLNVENLFDTKYWIASHNNNNISYGSPIAAYLSVKASW